MESTVAKTSVPISFYQVAWSNELKPKSIKAVKIAGHDLVIFRGENNKVHALDAFCPHLGAHLAVQGTVCQNRVRCGFHSWEFDGDGTCQKLPQEAKITPNMHTRSWRVEERYGIIFVYFDPMNLNKDAPFVPVPELESGDFGDLVKKIHDIKTRHSDVLENGVDMQHFTSVHGVPMNKPSIEEAANGNLIFRHQTVTRRLGHEFNTMMEIKYLHPGLQIIHLHNVLGRECIMLSSVTPIENGHVRAHFSTHLRKKGPLFATNALTQLISYFISQTFAQDIPIWNAKIWKEKPVLAKGDEGITSFRRWYNQFPLAHI